MTLKVTFELADDDLKHFKLIMKEARAAAGSAEPEHIISAANSLLEEVRGTEVPQFVLGRLEKLDTMIGMITDQEWRLPPEETNRVLNALAYFSEPEDLIPDHIPALGFLDDAIMVELVVRELKHEIEAYEDFCAFRKREEKRQGSADEVTREGWLQQRRNELHSRMRRRRRGDRRTGKGGKRSPFSLL